MLLHLGKNQRQPCGGGGEPVFGGGAGGGGCSGLSGESSLNSGHQLLRFKLGLESVVMDQ